MTWHAQRDPRRPLARELAERYRRLLRAVPGKVGLLGFLEGVVGRPIPLSLVARVREQLAALDAHDAKQSERSRRRRARVARG